MSIVQNMKRAVKSHAMSIGPWIRPFIIPPLRSYFRFAPTKFAKAALWEHVASHVLWLEGRTRGRTLSGDMLTLDPQDTVGRYIYYFGIWEPNLTHWMSERLGTGDAFIDIGANIGYYSALASRRVGPEGKVVAIEASPQIFEVLKNNLALNHCRNARAVNLAVWHTRDSLQIFTKLDGTPGSSTLVPEWARRWNLRTTCVVQAAPLGDILSADEIRAARIIKIDVEGAEWQVVSSLLPLLSQCRPDMEMAIEVAHEMLESQGKSCDDFLNLFRQNGFHAYEIKNDYSATAYVSGGPPSRPERIEHISTIPDLTHLIFSRIDAPQL